MFTIYVLVTNFLQKCAIPGLKSLDQDVNLGKNSIYFHDSQHFLIS